MPYDFEEIIKQRYDELWPKFLRVIKKKFTGMRFDDIQDLYSKSFLIVKENLIKGTVSEETNWDNYIITIGMNQAIKNLKSQGKVVYHPDNSYLKKNQEEENYDIDKDRAYEIIEETLQDMKEPDRSIIMFKYYNRLSSGQIAERLGYGSARVITTLRCRAMKRLRELVEERMKREDLVMA